MGNPDNRPHALLPGRIASRLSHGIAFMLCLMCVLPSLGKVFDLKCEGLTAPLGIDTTIPHFSWKHQLTRNGQRQTAYEIQVGSDSLALTRGHADQWTSGRVKSDSQVMIPYQGKALAERQLCYWRVRTWDERGKRSPWSGIERFAVGILDGMNGHYIGNWQGDTLATTPMFRKTITVSRGKKGITPVFIHINSLGYHDLLVNGQRVGDLVLQPAVSQLDRHSLIVTQDITPYLHDGQNEILIRTGQGWYRKTTFGAQYDGPLLRAEVCQLVGKRWQTLAATDSTWETASSGYSYTDTWSPLRFGGERLDANVQPRWHNATTFPVSNMLATPQAFEGNRIIDTLSPRSITRQEDGSWLIDFGRVITGWLQVAFAPLALGQEVTMEYCDHIPEGGTFECQEGERDIYIANGQGNEHFCNRFHHHAFRHVRVKGGDFSDIKALQISALSPEKASTFACSDSSLNAVHDLIHYTMQCLTLGGYMVDCPHLERMGYGGDGNSSTMTLQTMYDVAPTYMNWLTAWGDLMDEEGSIPHVAPAGSGGGGPYWCGFIIKAPWRTYLNYGDRRLLERHYEQMKRWLGYVKKYSVDGLLNPWPDTRIRFWFLGDWLAPQGIDVKGESVLHVSNCFISECLGNMTDIAQLLSHPDDAHGFAQWRDSLKVAIHNRFYHPDSHSYANGTPLDNAYALLAGVPTDNGIAQQVQQQLISDSYEKYKAHIAVGLLGVPIFTQWVTEQRQSDLMATILRQPDYPGYLNMINHGATATWESWDSERSRVHNCYNGIGTWFYQAIAGIRPDVAAPGYRHFFIDPQVTDGVTWVKASKPTPYGDIRVELDGNSLSITVPVGTTATVYPGTPSQQTLPAGQWTIK